MSRALLALGLVALLRGSVDVAAGLWFCTVACVVPRIVAGPRSAMLL